MTPEGRVKNEILSWLSSQGQGFFFPIDSVGIYDPVKKIYRRKQSIFHIRGVSDILGMWNGRFIAIEVKAPKGVVSPYQKFFLQNVNQHGGVGFVARKLEDVTSVLLALK